MEGEAASLGELVGAEERVGEGVKVGMTGEGLMDGETLTVRVSLAEREGWGRVSDGVGERVMEEE